MKVSQVPLTLKEAIIPDYRKCRKAIIEQMPETSLTSSLPMPLFQVIVTCIIVLQQLNITQNYVFGNICTLFSFIFTALHVMQTRYCDENSVCLSVRLSICPSVRLSVTRVNCDKTVERSVQIYIPYER